MSLWRSIKKYSTEEWLYFAIIVGWNGWWPLWAYSIPYNAIMCYGSVLFLFIIFLAKHQKGKSNYAIILSLFLYFFLYQMFYTIQLPMVFIILGYVVACKLRPQEATNVIYLLTKYISISILISLPFWLIHQYVHPLPLYQYIDVSSFKGGNDILYENYFFFIAKENFEAMRFYSLFDEPGTLGTLSAFILWANNYDFKKKDNVIILIGAFFTFSMAFYIITIIGFILNSNASLKKKLFTLCIIVIVLLFLTRILSNNLAFNNSVVYRFTNFSETSVDSRNDDAVNSLWNSFIYSHKIFLGYGAGSLKTLGLTPTSYKWFVLQYGLVGTILILISYIKMTRCRKLYMYLTLLIFVISSLQRPQLLTAQNFVLFACIVNSFVFRKTCYKHHIDYGSQR